MPRLGWTLFPFRNRFTPSIRHRQGTALAFQVAIRRPVSVQFCLRFHGGAVGCAMASLLRAGGFTFAGAFADNAGSMRLRSILTFLVDPDQLLDTLAELPPAAV
jgi:hypothetical protein